MVDVSVESSTRVPAPTGFSHISLPARDMAQAKRFFTEVLGGTLRGDGASVTVQFDNFAIALASQEGGATAPHREHPHYAFTVLAEDFLPLKERLEAFGVPTHSPWTRAGSPCALMYFRDPSGNQFEMFCPEWKGATTLRIGARAGGDYVIDFPSLVYSQLGEAPADAAALPRVRAAAFNHMTIPSKDLAEGKRFFTEIFGATVAIDHASHVTVVLGGAELGMGGPLDGGWTAPDAEYPHYTFIAAPDDLEALRARLASFGVPTTEVFSRTGTDASLYFRDPSGNLFELSCPTGFSVDVRRTSSAGGDYAPDVRALNYTRWNDPGR